MNGLCISLSHEWVRAFIYLMNGQRHSYFFCIVLLLVLFVLFVLLFYCFIKFNIIYIYILYIYIYIYIGIFSLWKFLSHIIGEFYVSPHEE
jgi:hypothetical protein